MSDRSISAPITAVGAGKRRASKLRRREALEGYLLLSPWVLGFLAFVGGPMLASLVLSMTSYNIVEPPRFAGLANYIYAFKEDALFWPSLGRTFYYAIVMVPLGMVASLLAASLVNSMSKGSNLYRTLFFLPSLTPVVATGILWKWIMHPEVGPLNYLLSKVDIQGPAWLASMEWAIPSLIVISLWVAAGGGRMVIFLAGLQGIPQELYEAAEIDGANRWHKFRSITLPMLSPTILFNLVLSIIGALKVFTLAYVSTQGGPAYATWFYALHIFAQAFKYYIMGYASALAWIFFVVMLAFTYLQFRLSSKWIYYAGEVA